MKRISLLLLLALAVPLFAQNTAPAAAVAAPSKPAVKGPFDPSRDAAKDLNDAIAQAAKQHKRVLVDIGGNWCVWCLRMDSFFDSNYALRELREKNYVIVRINYSPENKNEAVLSKYPKVPGYPHLFVLDGDGKLLHSQETSALELGKSYDLAKFTAFLTKWAPPKK